MNKDYIYRLLLAANGNQDTINRILECCGSVGDFTLAEIGEVLGISRERVRQIESGAMKKLRHPTLGKRFRKYLSDGVAQDICNLVE